MTAVVLFSGGMDSTVVLAEAIRRFGVDGVRALSIRYVQPRACGGLSDRVAMVTEAWLPRLERFRVLVAVQDGMVPDDVRAWLGRRVGIRPRSPLTTAVLHPCRARSTATSRRTESDDTCHVTAERPGKWASCARRA